MTTVRLFRAPRRAGALAAGECLLALLVLLAPGRPLPAQDQSTHWLHAGVMPPGAIGSQRLLRGGPLSGYVQPVKVFGPEGVKISAASGEGFTEPRDSELLAGLLVGQVYRFSVSGVPNFPELELYPTVELIDRLYPPCGKELKFPVPVELTAEELRMAANGAFVTRVIYVEDPKQALPVDQETLSASGEGQQWFEARAGDDPMVVADTLGRPIAILRVGSRRPTQLTGGGSFSYGAPPIQLYDTPEANNRADDTPMERTFTGPGLITN